MINLNYMSDIQDYIESIIKSHETLTTILDTHFYINRINNRYLLKIKDGYKLELQTYKPIELFDNKKS